MRWTLLRRLVGAIRRKLSDECACECGGCCDMSQATMTLSVSEVPAAPPVPKQRPLAAARLRRLITACVDRELQGSWRSDPDVFPPTSGIIHGYCIFKLEGYDVVVMMPYAYLGGDGGAGLGAVEAFRNQWLIDECRDIVYKAVDMMERELSGESVQEGALSSYYHRSRN